MSREFMRYIGFVNETPKRFQISLLGAMLLVPVAATVIYLNFMMFETDFPYFKFALPVDFALLIAGLVYGVHSISKAKSSFHFLAVPDSGVVLVHAGCFFALASWISV